VAVCGNGNEDDGRFPGMTVYGLTDVVRLRLEDISFFLVLLLVCAFVFRLLWNHATKGFDFSPS
jgi:hypothetical protein